MDDLTTERTQAALPTELTDAIIDHLHNDKSSLASCSLVCSSWLESSRYHLFHRIAVTGVNFEKTLNGFLTFLYDTPALTAYVRILRLDGFLVGNGCMVTPYILFHLLDKLQGLWELHLENLRWNRDIRDGALGPALDLRPIPSRTLKTLALTCVASHDSSLRVNACQPLDVFEILSAFTHIDHLQFTGIRFARLDLEDSVQLPALMQPMTIRELDIRVGDHQARLPSPEFFGLFRQRVSLDTLRKVNMRCKESTDAVRVGRFLEDVGGSLEELQLDLSDMKEVASVGNNGIWNALRLTSLASLKALRLHVWTLGTHTYGDVFTFIGQWCLCSVIPILSLAPLSLEHITIVLSISGDAMQLRSHLQTLDWAKLRHEFERLPSLEQVVIELRAREGFTVGEDALGCVADLLESELSVLIDDGILEVI